MSKNGELYFQRACMQDVVSKSLNGENRNE